MGQEGAAPTGEYGREPVPLRPQRGVTDGVDAAMERTQTLRAHAPVDRVAAHPGVEQLPTAGDPVLAICEPSDDQIRVKLTAHIAG